MPERIVGPTDEVIRLTREIRDELTLILEAADDHFGIPADACTWAHAGDVGRVLVSLKEARRVARGQGEGGA
jgi:hypothetical protein